MQEEFGCDSKGLLTITTADFDSSIQRITTAYRQDKEKNSKMAQFSHWMANFSPDECDPIDMLAQRLDSLSKGNHPVIIHRIDPNVQV